MRRCWEGHGCRRIIFTTAAFLPRTSYCRAYTGYASFPPALYTAVLTWSVRWPPRILCIAPGRKPSSRWWRTPAIRLPPRRSLQRWWRRPSVSNQYCRGTTRDEFKVSHQSPYYGADAAVHGGYGRHYRGRHPQINQGRNGGNQPRHGATSDYRALQQPVYSGNHH